MRLIVFILLFIPLLLPAQEVQVSQGIKLSSKAPDYYLLGRHKAGYVVERKGKKAYLDVYSPGMRLLRSQEIRIPKKAQLKYVLLDYASGAVVYLEQGKGISILKANRLDGNLRQSSKAVVLDTLENPMPMVQANMRYTASFNGSKHFFFTPIFGANGLASFRCLVLNEDLEQLGLYSIPAKDIDSRGFMYAEATNDGHAVMVFGRNVAKRQERDDWQDIMAFSLTDRERVRNFLILPDGDLFNRPSFEIDNVNNRLLLSALYTYQSSGRNPGAGGVGIQAYDLRNGNKVFGESTTFTDDLLVELTGSVPDYGNQLYTFTIRKAVPKMDGGAILFAESFYTEVENEFMPSVFMGPTVTDYRTRTIFNYNDVLVYEYQAGQGLRFVDYIKKRQQSSEDGGMYSSYHVNNQGDKLAFYFNEEARSETPFYRAELNKNMELDQSSVFNTGKYGIRLLPRRGVQTGLNEWIMPGRDGRMLYLVKVTYP